MQFLFLLNTSDFDGMGIEEKLLIIFHFGITISYLFIKSFYMLNRRTYLTTLTNENSDEEIELGYLNPEKIKSDTFKVQDIVSQSSDIMTLRTLVQEYSKEIDLIKKDKLIQNKEIETIKKEKLIQNNEIDTIKKEKLIQNKEIEKLIQNKEKEKLIQNDIIKKLNQDKVVLENTVKELGERQSHVEDLLNSFLKNNK
jgi:hypothetical protein